jgi:hypothetical protein
MAALRAPLEGSGRCFVLSRGAAQLAREKGADEVGMGVPDVKISVLPGQASVFVASA